MLTFSSRLIRLTHRSCVFLPIAFLAPSEAVAQRLGGAADDGGLSFFHVAAALLISLLCGLGAVFFLRSRLSGGAAPEWNVLPRLRDTLGRAPNRRLRVIETVRIGNSAVSIVRCDEEEWLLGTHAGGIELLTKLKQKDLDCGEVERS